VKLSEEKKKYVKVEMTDIAILWTSPLKREIARLLAPFALLRISRLCHADVLLVLREGETGNPVNLDSPFIRFHDPSTSLMRNMPHRHAATGIKFVISTVSCAWTQETREGRRRRRSET